MRAQVVTALVASISGAFRLSAALLGLAAVSLPAQALGSVEEFFAQNAVGWEGGPQPGDDQLAGLAVGD